MGGTETWKGACMKVIWSKSWEQLVTGVVAVITTYYLHFPNALVLQSSRNDVNQLLVNH